MFVHLLCSSYDEHQLENFGCREPFMEVLKEIEEDHRL